MTDIYIERHERAPLSDEAREVADSIITTIVHALDDGQPYEPITGTIINNAYLEELREETRQRQQELGDEVVLFGTARKPYRFLYEALLKGYDPSENQIEEELENGGHNFLWDEVMNLHINHYDVSEIFRGTTDRYWEHIIEIDVLKDALGVMYMRGRDYKTFGYGFPWMSDEVIVSEIDVNEVEIEAMK